MTEEEEVCSICLDTIKIEEANSYKLVECSHCFHNDCIIQWFRNGHANCPYCGNTGGYRQTHGCGYKQSDKDYRLVKQMLKILKKKDPATAVVIESMISKVTRMEDRCKIIQRDIKDLSTQEGLFKDLENKQSRLRIRYWKTKSNIIQTKIAVAKLYPVVPMILIKHVSISR